MPDNVTIRAATEADLPAILALYGQPELDNGVVLSPDEARAIFARFAKYPSYTLYVATVDEAVAGTFALLVMDNLGHLGAPSAIVEDVVVAVAHQSGGIGGKMMRFALDRAREANCYKLMLSSNQKRERAHKFYESLGFTRHGFSFRMDIPQEENEGKAA
jgi:ribosomal protein S18 acetylase RimI-like enzyme